MLILNNFFFFSIFLRLPLDKRLKAKKNSQARHHNKNSIEQSRLKKARLKGELADIERTITENRLRIDSEAHTIEDLKKDESMKENKRKELRVEMGQMADHIEREERVLEDLKQAHHLDRCCRLHSMVFH